MARIVLQKGVNLLQDKEYLFVCDLFRKLPYLFRKLPYLFRKGVLCDKEYFQYLFRKAIFSQSETFNFLHVEKSTKSNSTRDSTHEGFYSKYPEYELVTRGKYCVFPRGEKYLSNPRAIARGFERYFSTRGNMQYFPRVTNSYEGYFE